jgi:protein-S-isoprenylcysteine O-methyltransferase Ste14
MSILGARAVVSILLGVSGFGFLLAADLAELRKRSFLSRGGQALAYALVACGFVILALEPNRFEVPPLLRAAALLLVLASLPLLAKSLFLDLRVKEGGGGRRALVKTGTYRLCRHPGALWFLLLHASLAIAIGSHPLLLALPIWNLLNLALVFVEDRLFFPRIFGEAYSGYRLETPFLLPTLESLGRFFFPRRRGRIGEG